MEGEKNYCMQVYLSLMQHKEEKKLRSPEGTDVNEVSVRSTPRPMSTGHRSRSYATQHKSPQKLCNPEVNLTPELALKMN